MHMRDNERHVVTDKPTELVEMYILEGLSLCQPVDEIAKKIVSLLGQHHTGDESMVASIDA